MEKPMASATKPKPAPLTSLLDMAAPVACAKVAVADLEPDAPELPLPETVLVARVVGCASDDLVLLAVVVPLPYQ
jgi:hypothetical protein